MLTVPVKLHGHIVVQPFGQLIAGLHSAADAKIPEQMDRFKALFPANFTRAVRRAVVNQNLVDASYTRLRMSSPY